MTSRVLVIEDNRTNLELMRYLLEAFGHAVEATSSGREGVELARRSPPDLVVCDIQMPGMDGYQVARALKTVPALASIPLIAVTALAMVDDRGKVLEGGFDGYISKPINPETFVAQIESFLPSARQKPSPRVAAPTEQIHASEPESKAPPPPRGHCVLVVDNSRQNLEFADSLLSSVGYRVMLARDTASALDAAKADPPDLIISDVHLPNSDGFDFIRMIKADQRLSRIPFLFLSSSIELDRDYAEGMACGADDFVCRPIEPEKLLDAISACMRRTER